MNEARETLDVVDDRDRRIGQCSRDEIHRRALKHRAVHVFVFNNSGQLFVQKRAAGKDTFPGCYDSSASGHLHTGEDYDECALRELNEELGLRVAPGHLRKHFKIAACAQTGWEFVWVYSIQGDYRPVINTAEIESGSYESIEQVRARVREQPGQCAPSFVLIAEEFSRQGLWPGSR